MHITDLLRATGITLDAHPADKAEAIDLLVRLHETEGNLSDPVTYRADILSRENQGTTAIGGGIAVPHAKSAAVKRPGLAVITAPRGVDYGAPDGAPSRLFFMIAAPQEGANLHLQILARLMKLLMNRSFRVRLLAAQTPAEFLAAIDEEESETFPNEDPGTSLPIGGYRVLAVTACPSGIAHTYMAAEALEQAGRSMGVPVKAEPQGSAGPQNVLTVAEIDACLGIIIAADGELDLARFEGRPLLLAPVSAGINTPRGLIEAILYGTVPIYRRGGNGPT